MLCTNLAPRTIASEVMGLHVLHVSNSHICVSLFVSLSLSPIFYTHQLLCLAQLINIRLTIMFM